MMDSTAYLRIKAGQDATEAFYSLHRHDVITKPQYARLQVGVIAGAKSIIYSNVVGELSDVPYAEPTWLSKGYYSPYYNEASFLDGSVQCHYDKPFTRRAIDGSRNSCASLRMKL